LEKLNCSLTTVNKVAGASAALQRGRTRERRAERR
jgi:hypothetical protein